MIDKTSSVLFGVYCPDYVQRYATEEALQQQDASSSESSMSDFSEDEAQDMEL